MKPTVARLGLCAGLFVLWLGYLGYLVATKPLTADDWPLVVSLPQIQASPLVVVADLPAPSGQEAVEATIVEVLYPEESKLKAGDTIPVVAVELCRPRPRHPGIAPAPDWSAAGRYLLPLKPVAPVPNQPVRYEVVPIPPSPGFTLQGVTRIYPATREALAQYRRIAR